MDVVVFAAGIVLLLGSAGHALFTAGNLAKWAGVGLSSGIGVLGVVYGTLIANPRRQVCESVDHLMRLKMVFLAYLRRLHQTDQAYTRRLLDDEPITLDEVRGFADVVGNIMEGTVQQQLDISNPDTPAHGGLRPKTGNEAETPTRRKDGAPRTGIQTAPTTEVFSEESANEQPDGPNSATIARTPM
jgi:hypothetical protein